MFCTDCKKFKLQCKVHISKYLLKFIFESISLVFLDIVGCFLSSLHFLMQHKSGFDEVLTRSPLSIFTNQASRVCL